ncbi:hypothetical protein A2U01_0075760, partial [Trifolium medium]|nr:hypothetical protein [Trifolium medium]
FGSGVVGGDEGVCGDEVLMWWCLDMALPVCG